MTEGKPAGGMDTMTADHRAVTRRRRRVFVARAVSCAAALVILLAAIGTAAAEPRRVLVVHAFGHPYSPWSDFAASFRAELVKKSPEPIDLYEVSLDTARVRDPQGEAPFVDYIHALLAGRTPDLIVPVGAPSAFFMQRHRAQLYPTTPMLILGADLRRIPGTTLTKYDTGVLLDLDLPAYLDNILRLRPDTTDVAVVVGNSPVERYWTSELQRDFQRFGDRVTITWFNDLTFGEMLRRAAVMPPRSAIFWFLLSEDAAGVPYSQDRALETMREVASVPIFGMGDHELGRGIVGGPLMQTQGIGKAGAEVALRILKGETPSDINPPSVLFGAPMYDARELQRWGIRESRLAPDSIVQFREPTLWEQHRGLVIAATLVFVVQTAFLAALLIHRRRRRLAERLLEESEEHMTFAAASVNLGLWQFDRHTGTLWATDHCRVLFNLAGDAPLTCKTIVNAVHPEDRETIVRALRGTSDPERPAVNEVRVVLPDDQIRWIRMRARSSFSASGRADQLSGNFIDVTDQKAAEADAAQQRAEVAHLMRVSTLGELSGAIAHEINQPLTAILSNAQAALHLLKQSSPDLVEIREALQDIVHEENRAGEVIGRLRGLLKKGERKTEAVDVNLLVDSTINLLKHELIGRRIEVKVDAAEAVAPIVGDPVQLQQVLLNLVMNAMDAMDATSAAQRTVEISTRMPGTGGVEIRVGDRGPGIRAEQQGRLFQPFFTTKEHGLGLGLAICSAIVEAHGGKLSLTNRDGGGAAAAFSLPAQEILMAAQ
jgi:signal transduction histidine kinase